MDGGVAHDAVAHLTLPGLELRLDDRQQPIGTREHGHDGRQHERKRDEGVIDDGEVAAGPGNRRGPAAALTPGGSSRGHRAEPFVQLAAADVERGDVRRSGLQQAIGETARGSADVQAVQPRGVDLERRERGRELVAAARHEQRAPLDVELGISRVGLPAFVTTRPSTRTRPAITSAWARLESRRARAHTAADRVASRGHCRAWLPGAPASPFRPASGTS